MEKHKKRAFVSQGLCFLMFHLCFLTFRGPLASHESNPHPNHSLIARYNATKTESALSWSLGGSFGAGNRYLDAPPPCRHPHGTCAPAPPPPRIPPASLYELLNPPPLGGKHGSMWQNCVSNQVLKVFLTLCLIKTL